MNIFVIVFFNELSHSSRFVHRSIVHKNAMQWLFNPFLSKTSITLPKLTRKILGPCIYLYYSSYRLASSFSLFTSSHKSAFPLRNVNYALAGNSTKDGGCSLCFFTAYVFASSSTFDQLLVQLIWRLKPASPIKNTFLLKIHIIIC